MRGSVVIPTTWTGTVHEGLLVWTPASSGRTQKLVALQDYITAPDLLPPPQPTKLSTTGKGGLGTTGKGPATQKLSATNAAAAAPTEKPHQSMHQLKQTLVAQALLPLGSSYLHSK